GIAHEMNSPLAAMRMAVSEALSLADEYARSIGDRDVTDDDHREIAKDLLELLRLADRGGERASAFVRSIKSQTRDSSESDHTRFDAVGAVRDALTMLGHAATANRCNIDFRTTVEHAELVGSPGKLGQVVTNLVTNALDASAEKG